MRGITETVAALVQSWFNMMPFWLRDEPFRKQAETVLLAMGIISITIVMAKITQHLFVAFRNFVWPRIYTISYVKKYGEWAVVTGATDGLGKQFAREFARRGMSIMLISRNEDKLQQVAKEIKLEFNVRTDYIVLDFTKITDQDLERIDLTLQGLDLGILVNNVGLLTSRYKCFNEMVDKEVRDLLKVNVEGLVAITRIVLPRMSRRRKGAVVNLSSAAAAYPLPLFNLYAASKEFVRYLSVALSYEYAHRDLTIQCLSPFFVRTPMTSGFAWFWSAPFFNWFYPDAESYVRSAVGTIPYARETTGYWLHGVQKYFMTLLGQDSWCRSALFVLDFMGDFEKVAV